MYAKIFVIIKILKNIYKKKIYLHTKLPMSEKNLEYFYLDSNPDVLIVNIDTDAMVDI